MSRADRLTDAVVRWAKFPERNQQGITETLQRLKQAAEARPRPVSQRLDDLHRVAVGSATQA